MIFRGYINWNLKLRWSLYNVRLNDNWTLLYLCTEQSSGTIGLTFTLNSLPNICNTPQPPSYRWRYFQPFILFRWIIVCGPNKSYYSSYISSKILNWSVNTAKLSAELSPSSISSPTGGWGGFNSSSFLQWPSRTVIFQLKKKFPNLQWF